jgi:hypothetical protein
MPNNNKVIAFQIDKLEEDLDCNINFFNNLNESLSNLIDEKIYLKKNEGYFKKIARFEYPFFTLEHQ